MKLIRRVGRIRRTRNAGEIKSKGKPRSEYVQLTDVSCLVIHKTVAVFINELKVFVFIMVLQNLVYTDVPGELDLSRSCNITK